MQALNSGIAKYESDSNSIPGGRSSTHSRSKQRIAPRQAPSLPRPWKELGDDDRRAYLVAVRDHYGEGVLCERVLRSGRKVVALLDPRMAPRWEAHAWRDERRGGGGLYAEAAGLQGGRAHLAEWTGRECVLGGSAAMSVKAWQHKDGCPANCLPRNLELELVAGGRDEAAMLRMAQISARGALQHLYSVMGPRQGRRYLAALHSEYCGAPHS